MYDVYGINIIAINSFIYIAAKQAFEKNSRRILSPYIYRYKMSQNKKAQIVLFQVQFVLYNP